MDSFTSSFRISKPTNSTFKVKKIDLNLQVHEIPNKQTLCASTESSEIDFPIPVSDYPK